MLLSHQLIQLKWTLVNSIKRNQTNSWTVFLPCMFLLEEDWGDEGKKHELTPECLSLDPDKAKLASFHAYTTAACRKEPSAISVAFAHAQSFVCHPLVNV